MARQVSFRCILCITVVFWPPLVRSAQLQFDVASIKESQSLDAGGTMRFMPDGGIRGQNIPARSLIATAYELQPYQLVGAPDWARNTRYDIEARPGDAATREQSLVMLQALLVQRFRLAFHRESRQIDGFALVRAREGGLGPNLRPSNVDCEQAFSSTPSCREGRITSDTMKMVGAPMRSLAQFVINEVGAPVSDEAQLAGTYDVELRWSNEVAPADDRQTIYTALQEQLGLRLERRRVMVEVLVVDRMERASSN
jgi:uncharacterized protein (TIGR03435 family)